MLAIRMSQVAVVAVLVAAVMPHVVDLTPVKNTVSPDGSTIANMFGHLHFASNRKALPVNINSVFYVNPDGGSYGKKAVVLAGPNLIFMLQLEHAADSFRDSYHYYDLAMFVEGDDYTQTPFKQICQFERNFVLQHRDFYRYSCTEEQTHRCVDPNTKELVAELKLTSFELELDVDDMEKSSKGAFSKKAFPDSCSRW